MRPSSSSRRTALVVSAIGSGYLIRITARDSHSVLSLSARNSTALTAPVPISSCCSHRGAAFIGAASELGGAERAIVGHAARARDDRDRAQDDGAMQTREDVLALLAEREPVAQLGPGEHRAGRVDARRPVRLHRERAQFV